MRMFNYHPRFGRPRTHGFHDRIKTLSSGSSQSPPGCQHLAKATGGCDSLKESPPGAPKLDNSTRGGGDLEQTMLIGIPTSSEYLKRVLPVSQTIRIRPGWEGNISNKNDKTNTDHIHNARKRTITLNKRRKQRTHTQFKTHRENSKQTDQRKTTSTTLNTQPTTQAKTLDKPDKVKSP